MPSFSDSFWTSGYSTGLNVIFDKLRQGCVENDEVLALAAARADAEEAYGNRLMDIPSHFQVKKNGFGRDDGASLRKAYEGIIVEMGTEGNHHIQVAENIRRMVILPFGKWADDHRKRVDYSSHILRDKLKSYERELSEVQKSQRKYFNKCRLLEESRNDEDVVADGVGSGIGHANGLSDTAGLSSVQGSRAVSSASHINSENGTSAPGVGSSSAEVAGSGSGDAGTGSASGSGAGSTPIVGGAAVAGSDNVSEPSTHEDLDDEDPVELADDIYTPEEAKVLFTRLLAEVPQKSVKVPILGTYEHVSSGDAIVAWVQINMSKDHATSLANAEKFGQSLINEGFLRLVGQVGSKFVNSSVMNYQWKRKAFQVAGQLDKLSTNQQSGGNLIAPIVGEYLGETINNYINNPHADETAEERLAREVSELDVKYKQSVQKLDDIRCNLEETAVDHLTFMERCEFDRLKAVKAVFLDFLAALSNVIPTIQVSVDKLLLYQETVQPSNDLRYILESYRTGYFLPRVTIYDNYYNTAEDQIFGVELEYRSRGDKKKVPYIVSHILGYMDSKYPEMENDQVRLSEWVVKVPLKKTHEIRRELNFGGGTPKEIRQVLPKYEVSVVASVLKLYLVELPDSIIPSSLYDIIKSIYHQHGNDEDPQARITAIQNTLMQLRVSNIATLDAIMTHLTRLTTIAKASPEYIGQLAQEFSHCLLRPKTQSALTLGDRHAYLLVKDLLTYKERIFKDLKRNNSSRKVSLSPSASLRSGYGSAEVSRRPTLQNRMDALTLKIRKNEHRASPSMEIQQSDELPGHNNDSLETSETPVKTEPGSGSPDDSAHQRPRVPVPVRTVETSSNDEEATFYDTEESPPRQPANAAGRQDESLTSRSTAPTEGTEGAATRPIVID
ncbi:Rgd2p [Sugiyamaella lignohabitans]|uniref:Rgd2p n=1 Tax=Sugiyamaella lignohabitans TaxID=796027 RepID=A0A167CEK8_9ASCO|nr:Rgd2p [Sugiyamaella lignohabitans]ANB11590.1 Rgd2p [Sugiyamaella lignohabitans]